MLISRRWRHPRYVGCAIAALVALVAMASIAYAQEAGATATDPPVDAPPAATPAATSEPAPTPDPVAETPDTFREQTIYIPYKKLRDVFEAKGRGVFLPYDQFQELWQAAREARKPVSDDGPPVDAMITETSSVATVTGDVISVDAVVKIDLLRDGWHRVPLSLDDAAITSATINGKAARVIHDDKAGYYLLHEKTKGGGGSIELSLQFAKAIRRSPGQNSVSFNVPRAPISRWHVTIPEPGVKMNLHPLLAATTVPESDGDAPDNATRTVVQAFVGGAPTVRIDWTPKADGATGMTALARVNTVQQVWVNPGVTRVSATLTYAISRAELTRLRIAVPPDFKLVNVTDTNVRQWSVESTDDGQTVDVQLFEAARSSQSVRLDLEQFTQDKGRRDVVVPVVRALDVAQQQGVLVCDIASELKASVASTGNLVQIDNTELPANLARAGGEFAYRYGSVPYELRLAVEPVQPRLTVESLTAVALTPEALTTHYTAVVDVQKAGVFSLAFDVPKGFALDHVGGARVNGAQPVSVDSHQFEDGDTARLTVNLSRKAIGKVALLVRLTRRLDDPNLQSPTGNAASLAVVAPRMVDDHLEDQSGHLVIFAPESLRVTIANQQGVRRVPADESLAALAGAARPSGTPAVHAFAYASEAASVELAAERRKPYVTVRQLLHSRIEPGVVRFTATFFYEVQYSPVKSVRVDVPEAQAATIRCVTSGIRQQAISPQPDDVAAGFVAWEMTGDREFLGQQQIVFTWEQQLDQLDVGKSVDLAIPTLRPMGADRAWGQVVLSKADTIDVQPMGDVKGLRPIDPQYDLMPGATAGDAARAFEFHNDWTLSIQATQFELEEVKRTSIERGLVRTVMTRSGEVAVQAIYRMRSARQRLHVELPEDIDFDTQPLRVNGRQVSLERGDAGSYFLPLVGQQPDEPFVLELRYTLRDSGSRVVLPSFPDEPAVQKVYVASWLPRDRVLIGSAGPWQDQMRWDAQPPIDFEPTPRIAVDDLIRWVTDNDANLSRDLTASLQTDGQPYLYVSLRPDPSDDGALRLRSISRTVLYAFIVIALAACSVLMLRTTAGTRAYSIGGVLIALVALGVFAPTFAMQLLNPVTIAALVIVAIVWATWYFAYVRPRDPAVIAGRNAKQAAASADDSADAAEPASLGGELMPTADEPATPGSQPDAEPSSDDEDDDAEGKPNA